MKLIVHGNVERAIQYERIFGQHIDVYEDRVDIEWAVRHEAAKLHDVGLNETTGPSELAARPCTRCSISPVMGKVSFVGSA